MALSLEKRLAPQLQLAASMTTTTRQTRMLLVCTLMTLPVATRARAEEIATRSAREASKLAIILQAPIEGALSGQEPVAQGFDLMLRFQRGKAGAHVSFGGIVETRLSYAAMGGLDIYSDGIFKLDVLAELGGNSYFDVGKSILSGPPGADGTVPFAGARVGARWELPAERMAWVLGASVFGRQDLLVRRVSDSYTETHFLFDEKTESRTVATCIGGRAELGLMLVVGVEFGL